MNTNAIHSYNFIVVHTVLQADSKNFDLKCGSLIKCSVFLMFPYLFGYGKVVVTSESTLFNDWSTVFQRT